MINGIYHQAEVIHQQTHSADEAHSFNPIIQSTGVDYQIVQGDISSIPESGPVILVANHPFGGIDGIILGDLMQSRRPDSKLMGNFLLKHLPLIADDVIAVNPFGTKTAKAESSHGLRESLRWLKEGHCLAVFPAGIVAHRTWKNWLSGKVQESDWHSSLARLAQKTKATVVPIHFEGSNSLLFNLAGLIHPRLRTALLVREFNNKCHTEIKLRIGKAVLPAISASHADSKQLIRFYQLRSEILAHNSPCKINQSSLTQDQNQAQHSQESAFEPVAKRRDVSTFLDDLALLPEECLLIKRGSFHVYSVSAKQAPNILHEIGRTREETFRQVGEGTGKAIDLDHFDENYNHLFLWNNETCEVVGAYRIGQVDKIIAKHGFSGLYSNTIFKYSDDAFDTLGKTLELGRSYIVTKYQRKGTSLFLLWKGIMSYVIQNPEYTKLFGAVSISDDYSALSKGLIIQFLRTQKMQKGFEKKIQARKSPQFKNLKSLKSFDYPEALPQLEHVSSLVEAIEPDSKGVPTLIKHYLQLNGVILGIGVDENFNDALDGFILVDLEKVDPRVIAKYTGKKTTSPAV
ncbi:MAG: lysophospholipid acyltransferase family protein [Akkermansiaceae bacterium]